MLREGVTDPDGSDPRFPCLADVLADLAERGFELVMVRPWTRDLGGRWVNEGADAEYVRIVDGKLRCRERIKWLYRKNGQSVDRVYERDVLPVYGIGIYTGATVYPTFEGVTLGRVVA